MVLLLYLKENIMLVFGCLLSGIKRYSDSIKKKVATG
jgi:hypothetical protein